MRDAQRAKRHAINAILDQFATGDFDDAMMDEVTE
jgi:hypothetical protein